MFLANIEFVVKLSQKNVDNNITTGHNKSTNTNTKMKHLLNHYLISFLFTAKEI